MANIGGAFVLGASYNVTAESPMDVRMLVRKETDLTASDSWGDSHPPYKGMLVVVEETGNVYVLLDASNPRDMNNWKALGKGSSSVLLTQTEYDALESIEDNTIYYIYE